MKYSNIRNNLQHNEFTLIKIINTFVCVCVCRYVDRSKFGIMVLFLERIKYKVMFCV